MCKCRLVKGKFRSGSSLHTGARSKRNRRLAMYMGQGGRSSAWSITQVTLQPYLYQVGRLQTGLVPSKLPQTATPFQNINAKPIKLTWQVCGISHCDKESLSLVKNGEAETACGNCLGLCCTAGRGLMDVATLQSAPASHARPFVFKMLLRNIPL